MESAKVNRFSFFFTQIMVARNFSVVESSYTRQLQSPDDGGTFRVNAKTNPNYHSNYYELSNMVEHPCSSSSFSQLEITSLDAPTETSLDAQLKPCVSGIVGKKRKSPIKQNHSEIEKRRRDKMNTYITELASIMPMCHTITRKLDKLTVLRMAVQHLKTIRGPVNSFTEGHYKPAFLSEQELKHLILQTADGFLFVVGCDGGRILYVSESVSKALKYSQADLIGQSIFDILHRKDVSKVKEQFSASHVNPCERLIDMQTISAGVSSLCPGARRLFFCRMKCKSSQVKEEEADTTTECCHKKVELDKKYCVIQCTGYVMSWPSTNIGLEDYEDSSNVSCLVAIGRIMPKISSVISTTQEFSRLEFVSRHAMDGKFLYVDQKATLILGFLPQDVVGTSMYEYYHNDDIPMLSECHKATLQCNKTVTTQVYRFRTKDEGFVRVQSEWKTFKNPWTKEIDYIVAKNGLIYTDVHTVESSDENVPFFIQEPAMEIHQMIHDQMEASNIGRQTVEQIISPNDQHIRNNISLTNLTESGANIVTMSASESSVSEPLPSNPTADGNDEAAIAVIMSLLDADDLSGLPWQMP